MNSLFNPPLEIIPIYFSVHTYFFPKFQVTALNLTTSRSEQSSLMPSPFEGNEIDGLDTGGFRHSSFVSKNTALLYGLKAGDALIGKKKI